MRVALITTFAATRKEPLVEMMNRVHQGFLDAGLGEPAIRFSLGDGLLGGVSAVDRVLKRHPELERFLTQTEPQLAALTGARRITNQPDTAGALEPVPYSTLQAIAAGVPRSYPFSNAAFHFHASEFGELVPTLTSPPGLRTGVSLIDRWWVNGRNRSLSACTVIEAEFGDRKLPMPAKAVATVMAACGKVRKTVQAPLAENPLPGPVPAVRLSSGVAIASSNPEAAVAVHQIAKGYRERISEIVLQARLPHDLPGQAEIPHELQSVSNAGPKKPQLDRVFKPMGYSCRGGSGSFTLQRRTPANFTVEVYVDVGTWSHRMLAIYKVWGMGWKATVSIPPTARAVAQAQYPIGDAENWRKIVENLGALVADLDRTLVNEIEAAVGASPDWYKPES
ncbi:MAG: hypothetical protein WA354_01550 [Terracidiphilus sp.]